MFWMEYRQIKCVRKFSLAPEIQLHDIEYTVKNKTKFISALSYPYHFPH